MKVRTLIAGFTVLAGCAATTFAGERRVVDVRDHGNVDRHEVVVRHDDRHDVRDRDFRHVDSHWDDRAIHVDTDRDCR